MNIAIAGSAYVAVGAIVFGFCLGAMERQKQSYEGSGNAIAALIAATFWPLSILIVVGASFTKDK